jgi:iron complex outermembrane receptor protein
VFDPRLTPVAGACAILAATLSSPASAQEAAPAAETPIQSVVVTGIRRGIEEAISVKRNSDSIVEAISAEDIGKLPDASIAESIARLPGVTAQRFRGRAQAVSIRGMSPDFSTALLNGREQVSTGDSRGVEFDQYPAELLSGVVIYKTPDGALVGQGLSGTADLQTVRPLDFARRTVALNARKVRTGVGTDERGSGKRYSASYIDQFAGRTIGLALGFARLEDTGAPTTRFVSAGSGTALYNGATVNVPYNGMEGWSTQQIDARDGAMAVLQFRPNRNFNSTLDLFYSKYDRHGFTHGVQFPLNDANVAADSVHDRPGVLSNVVLNGADVVSGTFNNVRAVLQNQGEKAIEKTQSAGWKTVARLSPDWSATLDLSYNQASRSEDRAEAYAGTWRDGAMGPLDSVSFSAGSRQVKTGFDYADADIVRITDVQGWGGNDVQAGYIKQSEVEDRIRAARLSARYDLGEGLPFSHVDFGLNLSDRAKTREFVEFLGTVKGGGGNRLASIAIPGAQVAPAGPIGINMLKFDTVAAAPQIFDFRQKRHPGIYNKDWTVNEKVGTAFVRANVDTHVAGMPLHGNVGLQVIRTDQDSTAYSVDQDGGPGDHDRPITTVSAGKRYTDVLPSLNLGLDLGEQQTLRLALAKVMARPTLNDMRASNSFGVDRTKGIYSGSGGNPKLDPFRAKAVDLSYERYFGSKGYLSAAAFFKKLDTYVITLTNGRFDFAPYRGLTNVDLPSNIGEFTQPTNGNGGNLKGVELAASLPLGLASSWLDGFGVQANYAHTKSSVNLPNTIDGGAGAIPLPGLSRVTAALTVYYEKHGFSARLAQRYRSRFIGEIQNNNSERQLTFIKGERLVDLQLGYEISSGWLKGASLLVQMNNLTDAEFVRYRRVESDVIEQNRYGRTVLVGVNYKL